MKIRFRITIGLLFIAAGLLIGSGPYFANRQTSQLPKGQSVMGDVTSTPTQPLAPITGTPTKITLERLTIDLAVAPGYYNAKDKSWTLTGDKAHFATLSQPTNNSRGNTLIYGHNNKQVFGALSNVRAGDRVRILTDNGHIFVYEFVSAYTTNPEDSSIFNYQGSPTLTLQTCSGIWSQNRTLFSFRLVEAS